MWCLKYITQHFQTKSMKCYSKLRIKKYLVPVKNLDHPNNIPPTPQTDGPLQVKMIAPKLFSVHTIIAYRIREATDWKILNISKLAMQTFLGFLHPYLMVYVTDLVVSICM